MTNAKPKPIDRVTLYPVTAAIWKNVTEEGKTFYSFTLERNYKKADGHYDSTGSFGLSEALLVGKIADIVDTRIRKLMDADHREAQLDKDVA